MQSNRTFKWRLAPVASVSLLALVACNEKCCYFDGIRPGADCPAPFAGAGECGMTACVYIAVDSISTACSTGEGGLNPTFIYNASHRSANASYSITTEPFGAASTTASYNITLAAGANQFLGCGVVNAGVSHPSYRNVFQLNNYQMARVIPRVDGPMPVVFQPVAAKQQASKIPNPPSLSAQQCAALCNHGSGKCVVLPAESYITKEQHGGLAKLFDIVTTQESDQIGQKQLLQLFGMTTDPCNRSATSFNGKTSGRFKNTGGECSLLLENTPTAQAGQRGWVTIPATLSGKFVRDKDSVTLSFDGAEAQASLKIEGNDQFSRRSLTEIYGTAKDIFASAGEKCVDFKY